MKVSKYESLTRSEIEARLKLSEDVCVMLGWTRVHEESPREKAVHELWTRWAHEVGSDFLTPRRHRDLDEVEAAFAADRFPHRDGLSGAVRMAPVGVPYPVDDEHPPADFDG